MRDLKLKTYHKNYAVYFSESDRTNYYSNGLIESLRVNICIDNDINEVIVRLRTGESYSWDSTYIDVYNFDQFGIGISNDGTLIFVQTWDKGLYCLDVKTGEQIWKTKSRRGITDIFVGDTTITAQLHDYAMQLIDINTGEVLKEKRPCTAWGFTTLDHRHIVCQVTARKWEIIEAETLEVKETFTHKEFTGGHTDFCINHISLCEDGNIRVAGFQNVWDDSEKPPKMLPNIELEHYVHSTYFGELKCV